MSGNGMSQLIAVLLTPVVARFFTPAEIGVYAFLLSIVMVFSTIASGRYEQAIVVAEDEREAVNVFALGFVILTLINLLTLAVVSLLFFLPFQFFGGSVSELWAFSIPVFSLMYSIYLLLRFYSVRIKNFKNISISKPAESLSKGGLSIAFGWLFGGAWGLIIAGFASKLLSLIIISKKSLADIRSNRHLVSKKEVKAVSVKYYKFPLFDAPNALLYSFGQQGILIFLARLFSEKEVGIYSYTNRILLTPVLLFSSSFSQVMYQKLSTVIHENRDKYFAMINKSTNQLFYYLVIPFLLFVFAAKFYVPLLFGDAWVELYKYMYVMAPYSLLVLMSAAFNNVFKIDNRQEFALLLKVVFVASRILVIFLGAWLGWGILKTLLIFSMVSALSSLLNYVLYFVISSKRIPHSLLAYIVVSAAMFFYVINAFNIDII